MMNAYNKQYLDDAMRNLGEAFDYAVNDCGIEAGKFMEIFIAGGLAQQFGAGVPKYVAGMSGQELVMETVKRSGLKCELPDTVVEYERTPEYWSGWILAYYQWYTGHSFKKIAQNISADEILGLYPMLHEASEEKFIDVVKKRLAAKENATNLQHLRKSVGYSQKQLAEKSGVSLRMIQQYEQRAKDINKATATNLIALARTLGCQIEDLME